MAEVKCDQINLDKIKSEKLHPLVWENEDGNPILLLIPMEWSIFEKAQASVQLENPESYKFNLNLLALITLLRTNFSFSLGARLLSAGWLPHEKFAAPFGGEEEDPLRRELIASVLQQYPDLSIPQDAKVVK